MSNIPKGVKGEYAIARSLCLYGNGDGKPIASADKLAELSGLHVNTIRRHLPNWLKEREEAVADSNECGLALRLSAENSAKHTKDCELLRNEMDQVAWELKNLNKIIAQFEGFLDKFDSASIEERAVALSSFEALVRGSLNKQSLRKSFLELQARWTKHVGVDGLMEVGLTRAKADATLAAKMEAKKAENQEGVRDVTPAGLQVFQRNS